MDLVIPRVRVIREFKAKNGISELTTGEIPMATKYEDACKELLGDAQAKVSVATDMAVKEFGTGTSAMVSVTLSCNQDRETIEHAIELAGQIARDYCVEQQKLAESDMKATMKGKSGF